MQGKDLLLNVGFSHPVVYKAQEGITLSVEKNIITIEGTNKQVVGQTAAEIRHIKEPEPYKGKGIRYTDEVVRRKAGKVVKAGG
jgi:large subunit ribosomal protein L6